MRICYLLLSSWPFLSHEQHWVQKPCWTEEGGRQADPASSLAVLPCARREPTDVLESLSRTLLEDGNDCLPSKCQKLHPAFHWKMSLGCWRKGRTCSPGTWGCPWVDMTVLPILGAAAGDAMTWHPPTPPTNTAGSPVTICRHCRVPSWAPAHPIFAQSTTIGSEFPACAQINQQTQMCILTLPVGPMS